MNNFVSSIPGLHDITRKTLANGMTLLVRPNAHTSSVSITGHLQIGSLLDPDAKLGLADFTAAALMRGTKKYSTLQIYDKLESEGASLGFAGGTHTTGFGGKALADDLPLILEILHQCLVEPTFPENQVLKLRTQFLAGLALRDQSTQDRAMLTFDDLAYAGHPYRRPEEGNPETIKQITQQDVIDFHKHHFGPRGMVIVIVGGINLDPTIELVEKYFSSWENSYQSDPSKLPKLHISPHQKRERVSVAGKTQSDLLIGNAGPSRSHPLYLAASIGDSILGQFGMMGRLGKTVREDAGLAYYISSNLSGSLGPGPWTISAGVHPKQEVNVINLILEELTKFTAELVTEQELSDNKANYIGRMPLSLESNAGVAGSILHLEKNDLGLDYYQKYPTLIQKVTREEIREMANFLSAENCVISIAGPPKK
jgi:zinc protease